LAALSSQPPKPAGARLGRAGLTATARAEQNSHAMDASLLERSRSHAIGVKLDRLWSK
jgi:hypothetical protein